MNEPTTSQADAREARLRELGYPIPRLAVPAGSYVPVVRYGDTLVTSSISAKDGPNTRLLGRLGADLDLETGQESARLAVLNCLAALRHELGSLDEIERIVRVVGYVNSSPDFTEQHRVVDAASNLLTDVFGDRGVHVRAALGVASLPLGCSVGIEVTATAAEPRASGQDLA